MSYFSHFILLYSSFVRQKHLLIALFFEIVLACRVDYLKCCDHKKMTKILAVELQLIKDYLLGIIPI